MRKTPTKTTGVKRSNSENEKSEIDDDGNLKKQNFNSLSPTPSNNSIFGTPIQFTPRPTTPDSYPQDTQNTDFIGKFTTYTDIDLNSIEVLLFDIKQALSYKNYEKIIHRHIRNPNVEEHAIEMIQSLMRDSVMNPEVYNLIKLSVMRKIQRRVDRYYSKKKGLRSIADYEIIPLESLLSDLAEHNLDKDGNTIPLSTTIQSADIPDIKDLIHSNVLLFEQLKKIYTICSGIDGCHDSDSLQILQYISKTFGYKLSEYRLTSLTGSAFNPKKAIDDLISLSRTVEKLLRDNGISFIEEQTRFVAIEDYDDDPMIISARVNTNCIQESGRRFGKRIYDFSLAVFDRGSRNVQDEWIPGKVFKIDNVYGVNYIFITGEYHTRTHYVLAYLSFEGDTYAYYYEVSGGVSLNNALDLLKAEGINGPLENGRRNIKDEEDQDQDQDQEPETPFKERKSFIIDDALFQTIIDNLQSSGNTESMKVLLQKTFKESKIHSIEIKSLLIFSTKGVGDASVEPFYDLKCMRGILDLQRVAQEMTGVNPISTISTIDSFLEILIRLAYLCGKIEKSPPRVRQLKGGCIVTTGGGNSEEQKEVQKNKYRLIQHILSIPSKLRETYLMQRYGLDKLATYISSKSNDNDLITQMLLQSGILNNILHQKYNLLIGWLDRVSSMTYIEGQELEPSIFENLDTILSLSSDIGSLLSEFDQYTDHFLDFKDITDDIQDPGLRHYRSSLSWESPIKSRDLTSGASRRFIIVDNNDSIFYIKLKDSKNMEKINKLISLWNDLLIEDISDSSKQSDDDKMILYTRKRDFFLQFNASIELYINMYLRFSEISIKIEGSTTDIKSIDYFTQLIVKRLQKYSSLDYAELIIIVRAVLLSERGKAGGKKRFTKKFKKRSTRKSSKNMKNSKKRTIKKGIKNK